MSYTHQLFLVESRLSQLSQLRRIVTQCNLINEFYEILDEIKDILVHNKCRLIKEDYKFVPVHFPLFVHRELTEKIIDKMIYVFLETIVREFDISSFYDQESLETIMNSLSNTNSHPLTEYERFLLTSVSNHHFFIWKEARDQINRVEKKIKYIKKEEMGSLSKDACGICLDCHLQKEIVVCNCSHEFGQICFEGWMNICKNNERKITCPGCRTEVNHLTIYKQKGRPSTK
jgi:hypothetical protein